MRLIDKIHCKWLVRALNTKPTKIQAAKWLGISIRTLRIWEVRFGIRKAGPRNLPK